MGKTQLDQGILKKLAKKTGKGEQYLREQISLGIPHQLLHRLQIFLEISNASIPRGCGRRSAAARPSEPRRCRPMKTSRSRRPR